MIKEFVELLEKENKGGQLSTAALVRIKGFMNSEIKKHNNAIKWKKEMDELFNKFFGKVESKKTNFEFRKVVERKLNKYLCKECNNVWETIWETKGVRPKCPECRSELFVQSYLNEEQKGES